MKSSLIMTSTVGMTKEEWISFRFNNGLGASDVPCACGLTVSWKAPIELFYQLLDYNSMVKAENLRMFLGKGMEPFICDRYQYWDGTIQGMINNFNAGKIIRKVSKVNAFIQNPKYPWLFVSPDRRIHKKGSSSQGLLEAKLISGFVAKKYIDDIPPMQVAQLQTQLLVAEIDHGDLAVMTDMQDFDVYSFGNNKEIGEMIVYRTRDFMGRVSKARVIATRKYEAVKAFNMRLADELDAELVSLEPPLIGGEAEEMFLKTKYKKPMAEAGLIKGTDADFKLATELKRIAEQIKVLDADASIRKNQLIRRIADATTLDFGSKGYVSYKGLPRRFNNGIKI